MTPSSTPLGPLNAARRPVHAGSAISSVSSSFPALQTRSSGLTQDLQAKMREFHLKRQNTPTTQNLGAVPTGALAGGAGGVPASFKLQAALNRPGTHPHQSAPAVPLRMASKKPSLAQKRGMALPGAGAANGVTSSVGSKASGLSLNNAHRVSESGDEHKDMALPISETMIDKYADYIDAKTGSLRFRGKAVIHGQGVDFSSGSSFQISLDEVDTLDELGKGNYGTVYKVRHSRPRVRRPGLGLAGNKAVSSLLGTGGKDSQDSSPTSKSSSGTTGVIMAMKEIRLELDDAKFAAIIMELDVLHRCVSPFIIDFYGAFFQEGAVYICMEFMDGGSIDKIYGDGIPENVLRKIALSTVMGLKSLKDEHNIIHRDVKPTNILINTRGEVKICDFGVSGNLVASIAKTNIGCQSYMAPERISSGGIAQAGANPGGGTYSVQSDIWSLGLTIIECAMGRYPYPPETYNNIFSQLSAIVDGDPPDLPSEGYSEASRNFVRGCLNKIPKLRPTYAMLLQHAWLAPLLKPDTIQETSDEDDNSIDGEKESVETHGNVQGKTESPARDPRTLQDVVDSEVASWVQYALEKKRAGLTGGREQPPLHKVPLDAVTSPKIEIEAH